MAEEERGAGEEAPEELQPWEQHSSVIIIPRYDYNAPTSLLHHSHPGFLITCPFKREKSATKEAISILEKSIGHQYHPKLPLYRDDQFALEERYHLSRYIGHNSFLEDDADTDRIAKRRKLCPSDAKSTDVRQDEQLEGSELSSGNSDGLEVQKHSLSLVKMTKSGLLLFMFPEGSSIDPVPVVSSVHQSLENGALKRLLWCHRIFPIQATCKLDEKEMGVIVSNLVRKFVNNKNITLSKPLKFAVGYNRRGIDQTEPKAVKNSPTDQPPSSSQMDREKCFSTVASAVTEVVSDSVVDLKSPEMSILIECLPLSGVPHGSVVAAISVLPQALISAKPKLSIKALVADTKAK